MLKMIIGAVAIAALGYSFLPVTLQGDAYVLTKGRDTVPMALLNVRAYDYHEFESFLSSQQHYAALNCGLAPTENDIMQLQLAALKDGRKRPELEAAKALRDKCSVHTLLVDELSLKPIDSAITDKEGKFALSVKRSDIVLFATGEREVFGATEKYIWVKPVQLGYGLNYSADLDNTGMIEDSAITNLKL